MTDGEWDDLNAAGRERRFSNLMNIETGSSRIAMGLKAIGHTYMDVTSYFTPTIDGKTVVGGAIWAKVVDASEMVVVGVGDQKRVESWRIEAQHLLPEVRAAVNQEGMTVSINKRGRTQAFV